MDGRCPNSSESSGLINSFCFDLLFRCNVLLLETEGAPIIWSVESIFPIVSFCLVPVELRRLVPEEVTVWESEVAPVDVVVVVFVDVVAVVFVAAVESLSLINFSGVGGSTEESADDGDSSEPSCLEGAGNCDARAGLGEQPESSCFLRLENNPAPELLAMLRSSKLFAAGGMVFLYNVDFTCKSFALKVERQIDRMF